ncbi:fimbrial protein [Serratia fonticola]|uniref:fimbrial protein n=1 Tax=Serratia fonticola TaxID=47917 RepID=UPI0015C65ECC|nr:fimbrial protein [Serratia fonticola]MBC3378695.1 fimbrial protein [Serratia fonticola]NYA37895.1 fimbrial protein [Serratia fonticola]
MKLTQNKMWGLLGGLTLATVSHASWAVVACEPSRNAPPSYSVPLNPPVISAGADIPIGTIIFQGNWIGTQTPLIVCTYDGIPITYGTEFSMTQAPLPLSGLNTGPFAGAVYQTNIPGVGVAVSRTSAGPGAKIGTPVRRPDELVMTAGGTIDYGLATRYVTLIKIGEMTPGNYSISAAGFPSVRDSMVNSLTDRPIQGLPIQLSQATFQGNMTVSTQTCTTPDVNVDLGSHDIREKFKRIGSVSPWVDASISLTNCPTFFGFYNQSNSTLMMNFNTGAGIVSPSISNSISLRLTPTSSVIDGTNGVMAIDTTRSDAASGVGIQIGWGESSQTPTPFNFSAEKTLTLPKDGSRTIRVPLAARYIQTAESPTPGKANGKVTFTINYY